MLGKSAYLADMAAFPPIFVHLHTALEEASERLEDLLVLFFFFFLTTIEYPFQGVLELHVEEDRLQP